MSSYNFSESKRFLLTRKMTILKLIYTYLIKPMMSSYQLMRSRIIWTTDIKSELNKITTVPMPSKRVHGSCFQHI